VPAEADFDPARVLAVLNTEGVRYVLIGGLAAAIHASPFVTSDVDITPARDRDNLARLDRALGRLDARIRTETVPAGLAFDHSAEALARGDMWNLVTNAGDLDVSFLPAGTTGYDDLRRDAEDLEVLQLVVPVASLADVVRSKAAANRDKDRLQLPTLRRLLEEG
jgi:hypothetical protein